MVSPRDCSISHDQRFLLANEAGQQAAIDSVEALTGQHVDHFAEVNLAGFYELAQAFGGIEVCVKPWYGPLGPGQNLHDSNSGFNAVHDGYNMRKGVPSTSPWGAAQALASGSSSPAATPPAAPASAGPASAAPASAAPASAAPASAADNGAAGSPVTVKAGAPFGIPCVY